MPLYVYQCEKCGRTEEKRRTIEDRNDSVLCKVPCNGIMKLIPSSRIIIDWKGPMRFY